MSKSKETNKQTNRRLYTGACVIRKQSNKKGKKNEKSKSSKQAFTQVLESNVIAEYRY